MRVSEFCQICGHSYKEHTEEVNQILNANRGEKKTKESRIEIIDEGTCHH